MRGRGDFRSRPRGFLGGIPAEQILGSSSEVGGALREVTGGCIQGAVQLEYVVSITQNSPAASPAMPCVFPLCSLTPGLYVFFPWVPSTLCVSSVHSE